MLKPETSRSSKMIQTHTLGIWLWLAFASSASVATCRFVGPRSLSVSRQINTCPLLNPPTMYFRSSGQNFIVDTSYGEYNHAWGAKESVKLQSNTWEMFARDAMPESTRSQ